MNIDRETFILEVEWTVPNALSDIRGKAFQWQESEARKQSPGSTDQLCAHPKS